MRKVIYVLIAALALLMLYANSDLNPKKPRGPSASSYDRSDPKHPMHGIHSDSNCSVEQQMKGIYSCP